MTLLVIRELIIILVLNATKNNNDIINTVFTNDQFKNLLFEIETLNITNSNIIVPEVNDKLKRN